MGSYMLGYYDTSWLILIVVSLVFGFSTQIYIKSRFKKWSRVANTIGLTGGQVARKMLDAHGLSYVSLSVIAGELTDHYDPKNQIVALSEQVYYNRSVSALAIASHECGHAIQHALKYTPSVVRGALVPPINLASSIWMFVLIAGVYLSVMGLIWAAIILYAITIVFQFVTLPVEFNASHRAMEFINSYGYIPTEESKGARSVLTAAALTYVAAALISVMQLLYIFRHTTR